MNMAIAMAAIRRVRHSSNAMPNPGILSRRSPYEWATRVAVAAISAVLGYYSVAFSAAQVVAKTDPERAHRLAPYDGRITAKVSAALSGDKATTADRQRSEALAKLALRQDPSAVSAAATLGVNAAVRGDIPRARRLFAYAQKLSRRDLRTQLWAIEDAVSREGVPASLHQYDMTLRVFPALGDILYPILVSASTDAAIRAEIIKTLAGKPLWTQDFIQYIAANNTNPSATAALFLGLRKVGVRVPETARTSAINALIAAGQFDAAWDYYATVRPGVMRSRSRDPQFSAGLNADSQFDWVAVGSDGIATSIEGGVFDFAAPASVGGPLLQQMQLLPPGAYRLMGQSGGIDQAEDARPYWVLHCQGGREIGRLVLPNSEQANGRFSGAFSVPAGCPVQTLTLIARPSDAASGLSGQLYRVQLTPAE